MQRQTVNLKNYQRKNTNMFKKKTHKNKSSIVRLKGALYFRTQGNDFKVWGETQYQLGIPYSVKLLIKNKIKAFSEKWIRRRHI